MSSSSGCPPLGLYGLSLSGRERTRYEEKVKMCGADPFALPPMDLVRNSNLWPQVEMGDIHNYLILKTSFVTRKQLKAYKSLDAHNYLTSGWVQEPAMKAANADSVIIVSKVSLTFHVFADAYLRLIL
ncbi:hypothetical protein ISCGN_006205 [Ixodes scapularis]